MGKFRDMQEQTTFHNGRKYERNILAKQIEQLEAENKRLRAFLPFAKHSHQCPAVIYLPAKKCTCGFDQILKKNTNDQ